jgi:hypothetical protein
MCTGIGLLLFLLAIILISQTKSTEKFQNAENDLQCTSLELVLAQTSNEIDRSRIRNLAVAQGCSWAKRDKKEICSMLANKTDQQSKDTMALYKC